jgi:hypothetical protein
VVEIVFAAAGLQVCDQARREHKKKRPSAVTLPDGLTDKGLLG